MRKFVYVMFFLFFVSIFVQAQLTVTQEITKKGGGEIELKGKTFDEIWSGLNKTLMLLKFRIKESDKESMTILAQKRLGLLAKGDYSADEAPVWQIIIEEEEGENCFKLSCFFEFYAGARIYSVKKPFKKLCNKLNEVLFKKKD